MGVVAHWSRDPDTRAGQKKGHQMRKILITTALSVAALGGVAAATVPASASTTVKAVTISPLHEDTTSVSGSATQTDPSRGPVWAADHLKETITATSIDSQPGHYNVTIRFGGSTFAGFADPRSAAEGSADPGGPLLSQGKITGSIQYNNIASATAPDPTNVPATQAPDASLGNVLNELFHGDNGPAASVHYLISYTPGLSSVNVTGSGDTWVAGDTYTQVG
jgi:hypothetical protein